MGASARSRSSAALPSLQVLKWQQCASVRFNRALPLTVECALFHRSVIIESGNWRFGAAYLAGSWLRSARSLGKKRQSVGDAEDFGFGSRFSCGARSWWSTHALRTCDDVSTAATGAELALRSCSPDQLQMPFALWTRKAIQSLLENKRGSRLLIRDVFEYPEPWGYSPEKQSRRAIDRNDARVKGCL